MEGTHSGIGNVVKRFSHIVKDGTHFSTVFQSEELCKIQYEKNVDVTAITLMAGEI